MALDYKTNNYIYKIKIQAEIGAERLLYGKLYYTTYFGTW